jgi:uncharacterized protein (TIGR03086 family)
MFERAAERAARVVVAVRPEQRSNPTPCAEWDVNALIEHMAGGPAYLLGVMGALGRPAEPPATASATDPLPYRAAVSTCLAALREPGVLDRPCQSPAGFEWSVAEATAGTAMDQLIHTWDLAVATGQDLALDPETVDAVVAMFLPQMPEIGRSAGLVGPEVPVPADAPAQARLLGAMGRQP